jgi:hypothetical protein
VVVQSDGAFTYTANSYAVTFDQFTVRASDSTMITVKLVLAIDKSVPTTGEVKPGGSGSGGSGGDPQDARSPASSDERDDKDDPEPTSTPSGGRVQEP